MGVKYLSSIMALLTKEEVDELTAEFHKLVEMVDNGEFADTSSIRSE